MLPDPEEKGIGLVVCMYNTLDISFPKTTKR